MTTAEYKRAYQQGYSDAGMDTNKKVYFIAAQMDLKKIIAESREVAQALNEFANNLERIEEKYAVPQESEDKNENM